MAVNLLTGQYPIRYRTENELGEKIKAGKFDNLQWDSLPSPWRSIIQGCLQVNRGDRLSAEQVLSELKTSTPTKLNSQLPKNQISSTPLAKPIIIQPAQPKFAPSGKVLGTYEEILISQRTSGIFGLRKETMKEVLKMVELSDGEFLMGASNSDSKADENEKPQHQVKIKAFAIGSHPITQSQYTVVMGNSLSYLDSEDMNREFDYMYMGFEYRGNWPVNFVSWHNAQKFCQKLSQITGKQYRLPSEAEWEYACRAGTTKRYYFGDNENELEKYAWFSGNSYDESVGSAVIHQVGTKSPNPWGLYDMHGNVWEWCEDSWHENYRGAPDNGTPCLEEGENSRVLRGGGDSSDFRSCRSSSRIALPPHFGNTGFPVGFRVAVSL
jgi:formylglycine-generating enzyme required for sulfatase activity